MRELWIKICGLRTREAIAAAADAGADAVGFVFHDASPRNLAPEAAADLQVCVPRGVERVAVFLHPSQALIDRVLEAVQPDWLQTDAEDLAVLAIPAGQRVLPVLRTGRPGAIGHPAARVLVEALQSGAGSTADWSVAAAYARRCEVVLAGGLDAGNVAAAVRQVRPFGVDVSSGVESARGVKDPARIVDFVRAARAAQAALAG